jgi:hypothetical protein
VVTLQAHARRRVAVREFKRCVAAAAAIQAVWRGAVGLDNYRLLRWGTIALQVHSMCCRGVYHTTVKYKQTPTVAISHTPRTLTRPEPSHAPNPH